MSTELMHEPKAYGRQSHPYATLFALDRGGMGSVELAVRREGRFQRFYAIKRLHPHLRADPAVVDMFVEEARVAGLLRHPNVVSVLDVGEDAEGPFLVMDYVDGVSASQLVRASAHRGTALPIELCARIIADAAHGLHAAHELRGVDGQPLELVHRDISPQNLLVGFDGSTRVTDFGIAKALNGTTATSTGILKGKLAYMAPERLRFHPADRRADLFALGVVWYELLRGARLYGGQDTTESARRILEEPVPDIGLERDDVPERMVALLFSLLAKSPDDRPSSARDVANQLEAELAALHVEEGGFDIPAYLHEMGGELRATRQESMRRALVEITADDAEDATTRSVDRRGTRKKPVGVLAAALVVGAALTVAAGLGAMGVGAGPVDAPPDEAPTVRSPAPLARSASLPDTDGGVLPRAEESAPRAERSDRTSPSAGTDVMTATDTTASAPLPDERDTDAIEAAARSRPSGSRPRRSPRRRGMMDEPTGDADMDVPHWDWW